MLENKLDEKFDSRLVPLFTEKGARVGDYGGAVLMYLVCFSFSGSCRHFPLFAVWTILKDF